MTTTHKQTSEQTTLLAPFMRGLGEIRIAHPPGTFSITAASLIAIQAVTENQDLFSGNGLDWGTGTGCLAIAAARIPAVKMVIGLDISPTNIAIAKQNAISNGVADKTNFIVSDSYEPTTAADRDQLKAFGLDAYGENPNFILANPPSSDGDDGFSWRRRVLKDARAFLATGGNVFLSVSSQYGRRRVEQLCEEVPGFTCGGILTTTGWTPFDLNRKDLLHCLQQYAAEEDRGGLEYTFHDPASSADNKIDARSALATYNDTGNSPLMKWQTYLMNFTGT